MRRLTIVSKKSSIDRDLPMTIIYGIFTFDWQPV